MHIPTQIGKKNFHVFLKKAEQCAVRPGSADTRYTQEGRPSPAGWSAPSAVLLW